MDIKVETSSVQLHDLRFELFIDKKPISSAVKNIARQIEEDYVGKEIVLVGVLKGAFVFLNALVEELALSQEIEFVRVSSYSGTTSSGEIKMSLDFPGTILNKHVIIIEDIIDTGLTAKFLVDHARTFRPKSIKMASLLIKPDCIKTSAQVDYIGIEIPDVFVVGYGMDYIEKGRELEAIYKKME